MRRSLLGAAACGLVLGVAARPLRRGTHPARARRRRSNGSGTAVFPAGTPIPGDTEEVSVNARIAADGSVKGHFHVIHRFASGVISGDVRGDVTCLTIVGNTALLSGVITHGKLPGVPGVDPIGAKVALIIVDNGPVGDAVGVDSSFARALPARRARLRSGPAVPRDQQRRLQRAGRLGRSLRRRLPGHRLSGHELEGAARRAIRPRVGQRARRVREARLHAPAAEVLRHGDDELVLALDAAAGRRVVPADAAEEAVVARPVRVVAAVERAAVQVDDARSLKPSSSRRRLRAVESDRRAREDGVPPVADAVDAREVGEAGRLARRGASTCAPARRAVERGAASSSSGNASETDHSGTTRRAAAGAAARARRSATACVVVREARDVARPAADEDPDPPGLDRQLELARSRAPARRGRRRRPRPARRRTRRGCGTTRRSGTRSAPRSRARGRAASSRSR